jgi:hypothetical protein
MTAVILIAAGACLAGLVAWVYIAERRDPPPRDPFADPADRTDPDGGDWVARITGRPHCLPGCDRHDGHDGRDLGACMHGGKAMTATLATGTGFLQALPDDPAPDPTLIQPADVAYLGKPSGEYVDDLFAKHAEAQQ